MAPSDRSSTARTGAWHRNRIYALAARVAVVVLAFDLTIPAFATEPVFPGFDAALTATIAGALLIAACGVLALMARRNRLLAADLKRLEAQVEELDDRNWELKEATERGRTFLEALADVIVRRDAAGG